MKNSKYDPVEFVPKENTIVRLKGVHTKRLYNLGTTNILSTDKFKNVHDKIKDVVDRFFILEIDYKEDVELSVDIKHKRIEDTILFGSVITKKAITINGVIDFAIKSITNDICKKLGIKGESI